MRRLPIQQNQVLEYLDEHPTGITSMDAFREYGITRLSAVIFRLRERGYGIVTEMCYNPKNNSTYARYYIEEREEK